jgi:hypothetical protein
MKQGPTSVKVVLEKNIAKLPVSLSKNETKANKCASSVGKKDIAKLPVSLSKNETRANKC